MKKILLFITVMALAILCTSALASADSINDVIFTKGGSEVFTLSAGDIAATVNVSVDAETDAFLITSAYEDNRLANVQYESVKLLPAQKKYQGSPVTATATTTSVNAMLWDANYEPIGKMQSLTNVSREIRVTDVSIAEAAGSRTFTGYVDNTNNKIFIEQTMDWYSPNAPTGTYSTTASCQDYVYYNCRPEGDYKALSNTLNYKLNGVNTVSTVSLDSSAPYKLTLKVDGVREKTYDVILEKHVAFTALNFDAENNGSFVNTGSAAGTATKAWTITGSNGCFHGGNSRYMSGGGLFVLGYDTRFSKIDELQDTTADTYINLSRQTGIGGKGSTDGALQVMKKGNLNSSWVHFQIQDSSSANAQLRKDKYDYSFDFLCTEYSGSGSLFGPGISSGVGSTAYFTKLNIFQGATAGTLRIAYLCPQVEGYTGYGKNIGVIEIGKWNNIRTIVDADNTEGAKVMIVLNGEVILATDNLYTVGADLTTYPQGNVFKADVSSSPTGTFYIDNLVRTYSQAKPISQ